ncbi:MAG: phenylacetate-CoA oxygenase subunit PaaC [Chitinophagales bacterium]|nr:phenylacetate-CoA oxygenase subunit PaaC [Chitinophagales bacterium]
MTTHNALYKYLLFLGDNGLIQGHRLSELCSNGPILEEDLAMTNLALDHIGRAQAFLKYAGEVEGKGRTEDDLAYKRGEREFYNNLIAELPNGDFACTMARMLIVSSFEYLLFTALCTSKNATIAAIAAKAVKEAKYHFMHSRDWCYRLGKGTEESHRRLQNGFNEFWMFTGELFEMDADFAALANDGIGADLTVLKPQWLTLVQPILADSNIAIPNVDYMQTGSRNGIHTEYLGHILSEMQYLQRAYPDAKW